MIVRKNKKGNLMIKFLTTLILAIIIFAPACVLSSKIFRTSDQAKNNFEDFTKVIDSFYKEAEFTEDKSNLLIMDKGTALVYYQKSKDQMSISVDASFPNTDYVVTIQKPTQCGSQKNCLCLLRKSTYDVGVIVGTIDVIPERVLCKSLTYNLEIETCNIGTPNDVENYECADGFMIERHLLDKASFNVGSFYENPRRTQLYMTKLEGVVRIESR